MYLEGVILVRLSPIVSMTLLPHTQRPNMIPAPPYTRIHMGVAACCRALPCVAIIHTEMRGPMELLREYKYKIIQLETQVICGKLWICWPAIIKYWILIWAIVLKYVFLQWTTDQKVPIYLNSLNIETRINVQINTHMWLSLFFQS